MLHADQHVRAGVQATSNQRIPRAPRERECEMHDRDEGIGHLLPRKAHARPVPSRRRARRLLQEPLDVQRRGRLGAPVGIPNICMPQNPTSLFGFKSSKVKSIHKQQSTIVPT